MADWCHRNFKKLEKLYSPLENENKCEADFEVEERKLTGNTNNVNTENPVPSSTNEKIEVESNKIMIIERDGRN